MSDTKSPDEGTKEFEVVTEILDLWKWTFANIGPLVRLTWVTVVLFTIIWFSLVFGIIGLAAGGALGELPAGGGEADTEIVALLFSRPFFYILFGVYMIFAALMMFLYAIPTRGATKLALDESFRSSIGLGYLRFGNEEFRIALLSIFLFVVLYGAQMLPQIWLFGDMMTALPGMVANGGEPSPDDFREFIRLQSLSGGISALFLLIMAYVYARFLPAIPVIVSGGRGLGIRAAWAMTKGHGLILFGTVIGAYVALMAGFMAIAIGLMIAMLVVVGLLAAMQQALMLIVFPIWIGLMFTWVGFCFGYFQRLQVRVYNWLSESADA